MSRFSFKVAEHSDNEDLLAFGRGCEMPGAIRLAFDRTPDYFDALCVEGSQTEILLCRDDAMGIAGTGHRSLKTLFVNGQPKPVGYLSALRLASSARNMQVLARGYTALRALDRKGPVPFYLTTIMEDNEAAKSVLLGGRCGLPRYHDFGRFCCLAMSLHRRARTQPGLSIRRATSADGPAIISLLQTQGRMRQFFPQYHAHDFDMSKGLLRGLDWNDVFLAFRGIELFGVVAAWDQRSYRRWQVTGYNSPLRFLRGPANMLAKLRRMPLLPSPGNPLNYFILSLVCICDNDGEVLTALVDEVVRQKQKDYSFFLAGLHEKDPLLKAMLARPHVMLASRLYVVAWEENEQAIKELDPRMIPYLELGSL